MPVLARPRLFGIILWNNRIADIQRNINRNMNTIAESITELYSEYIRELEGFYRLFN
jgi:hypothetical protein